MKFLNSLQGVSSFAALFAAFAIFFSYHIVHCLSMELPATVDKSERCISAFIPAHSIATGSVEVSAAYHMTTAVRITDSISGSSHWSYPDLSTTPSRFSFKTADKSSDYAICFSNQLAPGYAANPAITRDVTFSLESTPDLFDKEKAEDLKIKPIEREFMRLEKIIRGIADDMDRWVETEVQLRDTNESINDRVKYFAIFTMIVLIFLAIWQILYLKSFFKSKKLI